MSIRKSSVKSIDEFLSDSVGALNFKNISSDTEKIDNVMSTFYSELTPHIESIEVTPHESVVYDMNLRKLSNDLYGSEDLWFVLAMINQIRFMTDFTNIVNVNVLSKKGIELLNNYMSIEEDI